MAIVERSAIENQSSVLIHYRGQSQSCTYTHSADCDVHGALTSNLCEQCMEKLVGFYPILKPVNILIDWFQILLSITFEVCRSSKERLLSLLASLLNSDFATLGLPALRQHIAMVLQCAWELTSGIFSALFFMWFWQPSPNDSDFKKELKELHRQAELEAAAIERAVACEIELRRQAIRQKELEVDYLRWRAEQEFGDAERCPAYRKALWEFRRWRVAEQELIRVAKSRSAESQEEAYLKKKAVKHAK